LKVAKTIADLKAGESAKIVVLDEGGYTCKLLNLGLIPNTLVTMVRTAPFGGAYYIKLGDHQLAVRIEEAKTITLE
jgi:ferrous iron transport protein A